MVTNAIKWSAATDQLGKAIDIHISKQIRWQTEKQTNIDRQYDRTTDKLIDRQTVN